MKTIPLWEKIPGTYDEVPTLDCYLPEKPASRTAVVIFPGGGYTWRAPHEGQGYAEFLNRHGIAAFVCQYRVEPHRFPIPLLDARRAVRLVRAKAEAFGIDPNRIYVMGSSAGGHLAALTSTYRDSFPLEDTDEIDRTDSLPNGQILCYPVIELLGAQVGHLDSGFALLGDRHAYLGEELSPSLIADSKTPKAFIWHTFEDEGVSVLNSLRYAQRLRTQGVSVEMHIYPHGHHGLGLAEEAPHVADWSRQLISWIRYWEDLEN